MTFSGPYEGIQRSYGRIWAGGEKKSKPWLPTGVKVWKEKNGPNSNLADCGAPVSISSLH